MVKKILVIDDDPGIRESLELVLVDAGYNVTAAEDGTVLSRGFDGVMPDLILLDYWLPRENGGDITRKLKNNEHTKDIPVIIISASYHIKDAVDDAGADDFLPKPYDMDVLLRKIEQYTA